VTLASFGSFFYESSSTEIEKHRQRERTRRLVMMEFHNNEVREMPVPRTLDGLTPRADDSHATPVQNKKRINNHDNSHTKAIGVVSKTNTSSFKERFDSFLNFIIYQTKKKIHKTISVID
jgi:hypothetical protein